MSRAMVTTNNIGDHVSIDPTPAEFVIDSKALPSELTVFYKRHSLEPSLRSLLLAKQDFGAAVRAVLW